MQYYSNYRYYRLNHSLFIAVVKWTVSRDSNFFKAYKILSVRYRNFLMWADDLQIICEFLLAIVK
jgi:hypothetical protein